MGVGRAPPGPVAQSAYDRARRRRTSSQCPTRAGRCGHTTPRCGCDSRRSGHHLVPPIARAGRRVSVILHPTLEQHGDQGPSASLIRSGTDAPHARTGEDSSPSSSPASHHVAGRRSRIIVALRVRLPARPPHAPHSSGSPSLGYPCQWIPWHLDARVRGHHSSGRELQWGVGSSG